MIFEQIILIFLEEKKYLLAFTRAVAVSMFIMASWSTYS